MNIYLAIMLQYSCSLYVIYISCMFIACLLYVYWFYIMFMCNSVRVCLLCFVYCIYIESSSKTAASRTQSHSRHIHSTMRLIQSRRLSRPFGISHAIPLFGSSWKVSCRLTPPLEHLCLPFCIHPVYPLTPSNTSSFCWHHPSSILWPHSNVVLFHFSLTSTHRFLSGPSSRWYTVWWLDPISDRQTLAHKSWHWFPWTLPKLDARAGETPRNGFYT